MTKLSRLDDVLLTLRGIWLYHTFLKSSCYWPKEKMEAYQFRKMKHLLIESGEGVPYYRDLFQKIGFNPRQDFKSMADMSKIPILPKATAKRERDRLNNPKYLPSAFPMRTSGSTGEPFEVFVTKEAWAIEQAVVWRHWKWSGYNFRDKLAMVRSFVPEDGQLVKREPLRNFYSFSPFHLNDEVIAQYLQKMIKEGIVILRGYPSSVHAIASYVNRTGCAIPSIKTILVASEHLSASDRVDIEKAFGVGVTNHYGLAEICVMMGDCNYHEGLHNYDEYGYLELLETDQPNLKKIIGTHLHNLATPLIRYETGDLAEMASQDCSCKRTLPVIKNVLGRSDSAIVTPEGYQVPTVNFYTMFEVFQEVEKWQIVQHTAYYVEVRVRAEGLARTQMQNIESGMKARLPPSMQIEVKINEPFIQKHEGKLNTFVSLISDL
jgi:phenylacetate-CoA ligase